MVFQELHDVIFAPLLTSYSVFQWLSEKIFAPNPPPPNASLRRPRIAVVGAGLTGVSAASHCVGHGFDVTIFEAGSRERLGGIWTKVNTTSGLQINSLMYRFQPSVKWSEGYPKQSEIVSAIEKIWDKYGLQEKTRFNTRINQTYKDEKGRWILNDPSQGRFDGIIAAIGTCGDPKIPHIPNQEKFKGDIYHSSGLDGKHAKDKRILVIGGGASAVEALEFVDNEQAAHTSVLARSEKWIIPRNAIVDALLSLNIFGQETVISWVPEWLLRVFFYRELADLSPPPGTNQGLFTETPMVNSRIFDLIRAGRAEWLRGDIVGFTEEGINFNHRSQGVPKGGPGVQREIKGDVCILATGFSRPSLSFLPDQHLNEPYAPPNWYLQVFPPDDATVCANNCTYVNAIGTVGNYHIGIYTRLLLMFLCDPLTTPRPWLMKTWVDTTRWIKKTAPGGAFEFFTYGELLYWFVFVLIVNPFRWKWTLFVLFGIGVALPMHVVEQEDKLRNGHTVEQQYANRSSEN